ncbi:MAG: DUF2520 domain-containing protein [Myxococcales bacterium]|nr:DUF2520 domain-containing protein [Myxococcales bacterium]
MNDRKNKPSVTIWGAGRLGTALAKALVLQGYPTTIWSRRATSWANIPSWQGTLEEVARKDHPSDLWIIAVSDGAIQEVTQTLAKVSPHLPTAALHCSGACALDLLSPLQARGVSIGVMHPLLPITERPNSSLFAGGYVGIEGDPIAAQFAQQITHALGGETFSLQGIDRALYHAAAVIASNFLVTLADQATQVLEAAGIHKDALPLLLPLMQASLDNLRHQGLPKALTGPYPRGDQATISAHREALAKMPSTDASPSLLALYTLLGKATIPLARRQVLERDQDAQHITQLQDLLDAPPLA